jgi:hypothetical protein
VNTTREFAGHLKEITIRMCRSAHQQATDRQEMLESGGLVRRAVLPGLVSDALVIPVRTFDDQIESLFLAWLYEWTAERALGLWAEQNEGAKSGLGSLPNSESWRQDFSSQC